MYKEFFGLRKNAFQMTPDPEFLYLTPQHREALAGLTYAILGRKGFLVLTGDAGTGKTTLLTRTLQFLPVSRMQSSVIINPTLTPSEFLEAVLLDFGFADVPPSKAQRIAQLQRFLWKGLREGRISALIVDEAHKLSPELLEEIRLLGNFESADQKLLQVLLVGQSELADVLMLDRLRQFKQRVALWLSLEALSASDVEQYIRYRWKKAGGAEPPFSAEAVNSVSRFSQGLPRVINVICDNALMQAFGEGTASVEVRHILGVCADLRLAGTGSREARQPAAPPAFAPPRPAGAMATLERYNTAAGLEPSRLARYASKLGFYNGSKPHE